MVKNIIYNLRYKTNFKKDFLIPLIKSYVLVAFCGFFILFLMHSPNFKTSIEGFQYIFYAVISFMFISCFFIHYQEARVKFNIDKAIKVIDDYRNSFNSEDVIVLNVKHINEVVGNDFGFWKNIYLIKKQQMEDEYHG